MAKNKNTGKVQDLAEQEMLTEEETNAHREHLKRLKKHKKKKRQLIIGLALEVLLLAVVVVGYAAVSYGASLMEKIHRLPTAEQTAISGEVTEYPTIPDMRQTDKDPGQAEESTPKQIVVSDASEDTTAIVTIDPTQEYTNPLPSNHVETLKGYYTYVIFGVDSRRPEDLIKQTQGDVIIIATINKETYEVRLASVYRDFFLEATTDYFCKLTDSYARFGAHETMAALNRNLDLQINEMVCVNWKAVGIVVDMMGGLDIEMTEAEAIAVNDYIVETRDVVGQKDAVGIPMEAGVHHCDGVNTLCYSRIRYNVGNDYARTDRQRKVINLMVQKAKTMSLPQLLRIMDEATNHVYTNINNVDIVQLITKAGALNVSKSSGFPFHYRTWEYVYADDLVENVKELHEFLYNEVDFEPSANVKRIAAQHAAEIQYYSGGN